MESAVRAGQPNLELHTLSREVHVESLAGRLVSCSMADWTQEESGKEVHLNSVPIPASVARSLCGPAGQRASCSTDGWGRMIFLIL